MREGGREGGRGSMREEGEEVLGLASTLKTHLCPWKAARSRAVRPWREGGKEGRGGRREVGKREKREQNF